MLIEIHMIQNHSPANLNRDDLGAPKTCYFGGVLRSRISSQCLKRSIRTSDQFRALCGGVRTRQLASQIAKKTNGRPNAEKRATEILELCGFKTKATKRADANDDGDSGNQERSKMLVYTTREGIALMGQLLQQGDKVTDERLAREFAAVIATHTVVPDMALCGRMLEADSEVWKGLDTPVEAALQAAHGISTHEARPEVDYYVAKDDIPGEDAGAGFVGEAMFASACFYKYFSINWKTLVGNLKDNRELAAHTVGAFIRGAAMANPSGKQNSFAAHNPPDGILVEIKKTPTSYANAFASPAAQGERDIISQSIAQLAQYVHDLDTGYGEPNERFWFSPNLRYPLSVVDGKKEDNLTGNNIRSLDGLIRAVVAAIGNQVGTPFDWAKVQQAVLNQA